MRETWRRLSLKLLESSNSIDETHPFGSLSPTGHTSRKNFITRKVDKMIKRYQMHEWQPIHQESWTQWSLAHDRKYNLSHSAAAPVTVRLYLPEHIINMTRQSTSFLWIRQITNRFDEIVPSNSIDVKNFYLNERPQAALGLLSSYPCYRERRDITEGFLTIRYELIIGWKKQASALQRKLVSSTHRILSIRAISNEQIDRFSPSGHSSAFDTDVPPPTGIITTLKLFAPSTTYKL